MRLTNVAGSLVASVTRSYSIQPTVTKLAEDRAEQLKADPDAVVKELDKRLRADLRKEGDFCRIHPLPQSGQDVPDDLDARLVVLRIEYPFNRDPESPAMAAAKAILESRGSAPRLYRNTLVFLAIDKTRLQDLDEAVRRYLAWESILDESETLDLSPHQVKQAQAQKENAHSAVTARIPEAYQWLLVPTQPSPQDPVAWQSTRLTGQEPLAVRASKKLRNDDQLVTGFAATSLRLELDQIPLWRGEHVAIKQLVEDFARYIYLPRLKKPAVLIEAIREGLGLLMWPQDSFAYADSFDEASGRYRGLRCGQLVNISEDNLTGLLVRPEPALKQHEAEAASGPGALPGSVPGVVGPRAGGGTSDTASQEATGAGPTEAPGPKRFHGSVTLDPTRVGRDAGRISDEVIAHLVALLGSQVKVTLEIEAEIPNGAPENVVRTVTENSRTLKFSNQGFETD